MKKLKIIMIICVAFSTTLKVSAQKGGIIYEKTLDAYIEFISTKFGIDVRPHKEFKNLNQFYIGWAAKYDAAKYAGSADIYGPIFMSNDKECMFAFNALPSFKSVSEIEKKNLGLSPVYSPISQIIGEIETNLGVFEFGKRPKDIKEAKFMFDDYVTTITGKKPRTMFNADTIFAYDLPEGNSVAFIEQSMENTRKSKYPHCTGIFIVKKSRVVMSFKLFFTEEGLKRKNEYIEMLSGQIWYRDDFKSE